MAESGIYVYVSHQGAGQISVLRMAPASGELSKVQDVPVTGKVMPMAVSPDRRFLFAASRTEPYSIASFAIDGANGTLTHLGYAPAAEQLALHMHRRARAGSCSPPTTPSGAFAAAWGWSASARSAATATSSRRTR